MMNKLLFCALSILGAFTPPLHSITPEQLQEYAIRQNDTDLIEILMNYGDSKDNPVLNRAMKAKDYFAVIILIDYGVDINARDGKPPTTNYGPSVLEMALAYGEISLVEYFLINKADPTSVVKRAPATTYHEGKNVHHLLTSAVHDAIFNNQLEVIHLFAQYNIDLNKICCEVVCNYSGGYKQTPLQVAIEYKKKEIVAFLLSIGVNI